MNQTNAECFAHFWQVLEQAAEMCCGNRDALVSQFREAGVHPTLSAP